jgi:hypothetical protein
LSYFCAIDKKKDCPTIYFNGKFYDFIPEGANKTWSYVSGATSNIQLANIYCGYGSIGEVCPDFLKEEWERVYNKVASFINSAKQAKIRVEDVCLVELIPEEILKRFCETKIKIIKYVFENYIKPKNYDFLFDVSGLLYEISQQKLNLDIRSIFLKKNEKKAQDLLKNVNFFNSYIIYNLFGTITGRLTTTKSSFPILNLKKEYRNCIYPKNDYFLELDYNGAELRMALALLGKEQPEEDLHEWNIKNISKLRGVTRTEAKEKVFQYLYNPKVVNEELEKIYGRDEILYRYWNRKYIENYFGRVIPVVEKHYAISYLTQSSLNDLVLFQTVKLFNLLKSTNSKSFIFCTIHDAIVIDLAEDERHCVEKWIKLFNETPFGKFKVNVSIGKNLGEMKRV